MTGEPRSLAVIAGIAGLVGSTIADELGRRGGIDVLGLGRTRPADWPGAFHAVDLLDPESCRRAAARCGGVTHLYFAARQQHAEPTVEDEINTAMLRNLLTALDGPGLRHVGLVHGTKWYGHHLGPYRIPAREDDPRHLPPNFYYSQHDFTAAFARGKPWTWTSMRPAIVCGAAIGSTNNLVLLLAAYAAICRALGVAFEFPGSEGRWNAVSQLSDARHLARAMIWASDRPDCSGEAFNMVASDVFRWRDLWPRLAAMLGVEPGGLRTMPMAAMMRDKAPVWEGIVSEHGLQTTPFDRLGSWAFLDNELRSGKDDISSTVKIRRFGFAEVVEPEESFRELFASLRSRRIIP